MFIGRETELKQLEQLYSDGAFHLVALYGRHRIGKTALLTEFTRKKDTLFFTAMETNALQNTALFFLQLKKYRFPFSESLTPTSTIPEMLELLFVHSINKPLILVIDDYHFLTKSIRNFPSILENLIQQYRHQSHMLLLLSCSSPSISEKEFLSSKSPYQRSEITLLHLKQLGFFECRKFFRNISNLDMVAIYGMVGGIPDYLLMINDRLSFEENMKNTFLNPSSPLFAEPTLLLRQEVREPALYNAILCAIADGASKLSEISQVIDEETSVGAAYLKAMTSMEIVRKEIPIGETSSKKTIYRIDDALFRFWYSFLPPLLSDIKMRNTEAACKQIEPRLPAYMQDVFVEICKQYLIGLSETGKTPVPIKELGCWWGTDPFTREKILIPILGSDGNGTLLFGSCKWSRERMDIPDLHTLMEKSESFHCTKRYYYLFSRSGFTHSCQDAAAQLDNIILVSFSK